MREIKILAINTSPRKGRNTQQLLEEVLAGCRSAAGDASGGNGMNVVTRLIQISDAPEGSLKLCKGCWACGKTGRCACGDDFIQEIFDAIAEADGVVWGVPVYFYDVPAQCKAIMDRSLACQPMGQGKATATAITCGSAGVLSTLQTLQGFYNVHNFIDAGWVATYGKTKDKEKGKETAFDLGRKLVRLADIIKSARAEAQASGDEDLLKDLDHSNHFAYGTHTF